jgi:predicted unusual protein kinase regulating ubiquinone biosynthesis (AarF/ABC1/UbiB family)
MLNGLGTQLDTETNIIEIAAPFAKRFIRAEEFTASGILEQAAISARSLVKLPKLLNDFLVTTSRGETRVEITSRQVVDELRNIGRIGKAFTFAVLTAALGLISVFLHINHFESESFWTAVAATVLFLWILHILSKTPDGSD